jgi:demethylmenaquinone methyltransferase/2-methoxy-6-polyprenyl-1,4-benzoquinol methylase
VKALFSRIAARYDLMNDLMSLGQVEGWRAAAVREMELPAGARVLDVGTGTGALARHLARSGAEVVALDFSPDMLGVARGKLAHAGCEDGVQGVLADALALPFADGTFHGASNAFVLRNVEDVKGALSEMHRVVRAGGKVVTLELARPGQPLFARLYTLYMGRVVPLVGGMVTGARWAYATLLPSLDRVPAPEGMATLMHEVGFQEVRYRTLTLGVAAIYAGVK